MSNIELSYQIYSEFKDSDWYIYWDKEFSRAKKYQLLVVWFVNEYEFVNYDYITLKKLIQADSAQNGLPYVNQLSESQIKEFLTICKEFIADIDLVFGTED